MFVINPIKKIYISISIILLLLSCNLPMNREGNNSGTLSLTVGNIGSRTIAPQLDIVSYKISFLDGPAIKDEITTAETTVDITLLIGTWDIKVEALDSESKIIATGSLTNVLINESSITSRTIDIRPLDTGLGKVDISINWPESVGIDTKEITLNSVNIDSGYITETVSDGSVSIKYIQDLIPGDYKLKIQLKEGSLLKAEIIEIVKVYGNLSSIGVINLSEDDFTSEPEAPTNLQVSSTVGKLVLNWIDNSYVETGFVLERSTGDNSKYSILADNISASSESYDDTTITVGETYYYRLKAINSFGESSYSNEAVLTAMESNIDLDVDMKNPIGITFSGTNGTIFYGIDSTITASVTETVDSYNWYLDSQLLSQETSESITIGSDLGQGNYRLTLMVKKDNVYSSKSLEFEVRDMVLGDSYGGGIVFYLYESGGGLIAAEEDLSIEYRWHNETNIEIRCWDQEIGSGKANTNAIINAQGDGVYAAKACDDLVLNGYDDWFLPSLDELDKLNENKDFFSNFKTQYWSSTEYRSNKAYVYVFAHGTSYADNLKAEYEYVRAIREF